MTPAEFDAISRLLHGAPGKAQDGARLVLVEGVSQREAGKVCGVSPTAVCRIVARIRALQTKGCPVCGRPAISP